MSEDKKPEEKVEVDQAASAEETKKLKRSHKTEVEQSR